MRLLSFQVAIDSFNSKRQLNIYVVPKVVAVVANADSDRRSACGHCFCSTAPHSWAGIDSNEVYSDGEDDPRPRQKLQEERFGNGSRCQLEAASMSVFPKPHTYATADCGGMDLHVINLIWLALIPPVIRAGSMI
jgi:hypothetical protein